MNAVSVFLFYLEGKEVNTNADKQHVIYEYLNYEKEFILQSKSIEQVS